MRNLKLITLSSLILLLFIIPELHAQRNIDLSQSSGDLRVLADRFYSKGIYHLQMETSGLASGVYFYKIETKKFSEKRKMVVLR